MLNIEKRAAKLFAKYNGDLQTNRSLCKEQIMLCEELAHKGDKKPYVDLRNGYIIFCCLS